MNVKKISLSYPTWAMVWMLVTLASCEKSCNAPRQEEPISTKATTKKQVKIEIPDPNNALFKGDDPFSIKLLNEGEPISTDKLRIVLTSIPPDGFSYPKLTIGTVELEKASTTTTQLTQIRGGKEANLSTKGSVDFELRCDNKYYNRAKELEIDFQLEVWHDKQKLDSKSIKWKNQKIQIQFVEPASDNAFIKGADSMKIRLKNIGEAAVNLQGLKAKIISDGKLWEAYSQIQAFQLGGTNGVSTAWDLIDIIEEGLEVLKPNEIVTFTLQLPTEFYQMAEFDFPLEIQVGGEKLATQTIKWRPKKVQVEFVNPADGAVLQGKGILPIELKNTGETDIDFDELDIALKFKEKLSGPRPDFYLQDTIASEHGTELSKILAQGTLKPNQTISFNLKRYDFGYLSMTKEEYRIELQVERQSKIIATKNITVNKENIQIEFVAPANDELFTGTNPLTIALRNTGDDVSTDNLFVGLTPYTSNPTMEERRNVASMFSLGSAGSVNYKRGDNLTHILNKGTFVFRKGSTLTFELKRNGLSDGVPTEKPASMQVFIGYEESSIGCSKLINWHKLGST